MAEVAEKNTETEDRIRPRFRAKQRLARISPQKLRLVADMIRGKDYNTAISILKACPRRGAVYCRKVLESAMGNATKIIDNPENLKKKRDEYPPDALREVDVDALHVVEIRVDGGPVMKRWRPSSMRRPTMIQKKFSHLEIILQERELKQSKKEKARQRRRKLNKEKQEAAKAAAEEAEEKKGEETPEGADAPKAEKAAPKTEAKKKVEKKPEKAEDTGTPEKASDAPAGEEEEKKD